MKRGAEYINSDTKRALDVAGSLVIAGSLLPVAIPIGLESMAEHRTLNPFFRQERIGKLGASILISKFETLHETDNTSRLLGGYDHPGASLFGKAVRRSGLDEVPQLMSVFKGDISLVGIRPVPQTYLDHYQSFTASELYSQWLECYQHNPGLTGDGQLFTKQFPVHTPAVIKRQMELDITATEKASLSNDLLALIRTPPIMLRHALGLAPPAEILQDA